MDEKNQPHLEFACSIMALEVEQEGALCQAHASLSDRSCQRPRAFQRGISDRFVQDFRLSGDTAEAFAIFPSEVLQRERAPALFKSFKSFQVPGWTIAEPPAL